MYSHFSHSEPIPDHTEGHVSLGGTDRQEGPEAWLPHGSDSHSHHGGVAEPLWQVTVTSAVRLHGCRRTTGPGGAGTGGGWHQAGRAWQALAQRKALWGQEPEAPGKKQTGSRGPGVRSELPLVMLAVGLAKTLSRRTCTGHQSRRPALSLRTRSRLSARG